jgi:hypothetical protein
MKLERAALLRLPFLLARDVPNALRAMCKVVV